MTITIKAEYDTKREFDTVLIALRDFIVGNKKCKANLTITKRQNGNERLGLETVDMDELDRLEEECIKDTIKTWSNDLTEEQIINRRK